MTLNVIFNVGAVMAMVGNASGVSTSAIVSPIFASAIPVKATMSPAIASATSIRCSPLYDSTRLIFWRATTPSRAICATNVFEEIRPRTIRPIAYLPL